MTEVDFFQVQRWFAMFQMSNCYFMCWQKDIWAKKEDVILPEVYGLKVWILNQFQIVQHFDSG